MAELSGRRPSARPRIFCLVREDSRHRDDRHRPQEQDDGEQHDLDAQQHIEELICRGALSPLLPVGHSGVYLSRGEERRGDHETAQTRFGCVGSGTTIPPKRFEVRGARGVTPPAGTSLFDNCIARTEQRPSCDGLWTAWANESRLYSAAIQGKSVGADTPFRDTASLRRWALHPLG